VLLLEPKHIVVYYRVDWLTW